MTAVWALIAGFGMGLGAWSVMDRLAHRAAGQPAAAGAGAPPQRDRLDDLADGFMAGLAAQDWPAPGPDWPRPSTVLRPPLPLWDGNGQGLHEIPMLNLVKVP